MSILATFQRDFIASLFERSAGSNGLEVYRRTVFANLQGALAAAYPVVQRLVGESFFEGAAETFVRAVRSTSGDLNEFGAGFAGFLAEYPPASNLEYLPDVARLEWALHESHYAPDAPVLDFAALAAVPPDAQGAIRFVLHPASRRIASAHPIHAIWIANQSGRDGTPARREGADRVLVRRVDGVATPELLDAHEWALLEAMACGATLEGASATMGDPAPLAAALARFSGEGVFCGFTVTALA